MIKLDLNIEQLDTLKKHIRDLNSSLAPHLYTKEIRKQIPTIFQNKDKITKFKNDLIEEINKKAYK